MPEYPYSSTSLSAMFLYIGSTSEPTSGLNSLPEVSCGYTFLNTFSAFSSQFFSADVMPVTVYLYAFNRSEKLTYVSGYSFFHLLIVVTAYV